MDNLQNDQFEEAPVKKSFITRLETLQKIKKKDTPPKPFLKCGEKFKLIRKELQINSRDFAKLLGVPNSRFNSWENGYNRPKLCTLLDIKSQLPYHLSKLLKMKDFGYNSKETD